jgi:hypothetical protein
MQPCGCDLGHVARHREVTAITAGQANILGGG